ncbi:MAG: hypothetical protein CMI56_00680 [Parcubacteria group bacterium]|nr:hypothetical protein [Parcubacteria group bacterium]|eukprot:g4324.t1
MSIFFRHTSRNAAALFSTASQNPLSVTLYQYKICPFCNKVKALLDFCDIPYQTVEVNPLTKNEISFATNYRKVPQAHINGEHFVESSEIMRHILSKTDKIGNAEAGEMAQDWVRWADEKLAVLLFPNLVRTLGESRAAFSYVYSVPHFTATQKFLNHNVGGLAMWLASGKLKKKYGIKDEREALYSAVDHWTSDALENGKKSFAGGDKPHLGDVAVFGVLRSLQGLSIHKELLFEGSRPCLEKWYFDMEKEVGNSLEEVVSNP